MSSDGSGDGMYAEVSGCSTGSPIGGALASTGNPRGPVINRIIARLAPAKIVGFVIDCGTCPCFTRFALRRRGGPVGGLLLADVDQLDWFLV